jgi:MFS superfamily sulfate permease-like transporter
VKVDSTELSSFSSDILPTWYTNWIASLPLILLTVLIHVSGLAEIKNRAIDLVERAAARGNRNFVFVLIIGCTVVLVTMLHGIEAAVWAVAYLLLGALPNSHSAMLYSLGAMTTYGNASVHLEAQWELMGVVESLNGVILFGFTVATLFSINERIPAGSGKKELRD